MIWWLPSAHQNRCPRGGGWSPTAGTSGRRPGRRGALGGAAPARPGLSREGCGFGQARPPRFSWRGVQDSLAPVRMLSGRGRGRREDKSPRKGTVGFLMSVLSWRQPVLGKTVSRGNPHSAAQSKPRPAAVCRGILRGCHFNTGTQNNRQGGVVCAPCLSVGKKQMKNK